MPVLRVAITLLLGLTLASCSAEPAAPPSSPGTTTTSTPPEPVPATTAEYQALLSAFDQALTPPMDAVAAAASPEALQAGRTATLQALKAQIEILTDAVPPTAVTAAHRAFVLALAPIPYRLQEGITAGIPAARANSCGVALDPLPAVKNKATAWSREVSIKPLVDLGFTFGTFVKPAVPEPAASTENRRAANGKIIQREGPRGRGRLEITNSSDSDFAVSVVTSGDPKRPQATIYVWAGSNATLTAIAGTYQVYFKTGADWDEGRRGFTRDCAYEKFEQPFDQSANWRISLEKSIAGNARTDEVPPF